MSSTNGKKIYPQILSEDGSLSTSKKSASGLILCYENESKVQP